ncbi:hypothetical protein RHMOL_Rhmol09G0135300 [Rhododendron molle]|uniref:Uncharacterized protein n=1 Tax=Rhododendron molle TaxID=49168 RepID=A0ACC0MCR3_RHOML|nr:hypothetical protein RHMOL_Rhmol09G0135300 [Rhododendron molle]
MSYSSNQTVPWSSGLYDCCDDVANCKLNTGAKLCCVTCYVPCVTFGQIAEILLIKEKHSSDSITHP